MAALRICVLGPFQVLLDNQPVTHFESNKVRALLTYLAVEPDRPYSREYLADLLWPDSTRSSALGNLRYTLSSLRKNLHARHARSKIRRTPYFTANRESLQFNTSSSVSMDVWEFSHLSKSEVPNLSHAVSLERAINLYRGDFLEGFVLPECAGFEEWLLLKREQYRRQMLKYLHQLAGHYLHIGEYERSQGHAWKQVEMEPWLEEGYQQLMCALALAGQRSAALTQYSTCRRLLKEELGIEPSRETQAIYESIRDDSITETHRNCQGEWTLNGAGSIKPPQVIGIIHSPFRSGEQIPVSSGGALVSGQVEIFPEYADNLLDIEGFSHLILLYRFPDSPDLKNQLKYIPQTISAHYPALSDQLGMSIVRLESRQDNILEISGVDVPDGTALLEIKPYMLEFETPENGHHSVYEECRYP